MHLTPMTIRIRARATIICSLGAFVALAAGICRAQNPLLPAGTAELKFAREIGQLNPLATPIPFESTDFIRFVTEEAKVSVRWGEPLVLGLRLVNHTQFEVTIQTNFHPRGRLEVTIRPEGERAIRNYGPFSPGQYSDLDYPLYPYEEFPMKLMFWADANSPNGLIFPRPGKYFVKLELSQIGARNSEVSGRVPLIDANYEPVPEIEVTVLPAEEAARGMIDELIELGCIPALHVISISSLPEPDALREKLRVLIDKYPDSTLAPYLELSVGMDYWRLAGADPEDDASIEAIETYLRRAAQHPDYTLRGDALSFLLSYYDAMGRGVDAHATSARMVESAPAQSRHLVGSHSTVIKYLRNSREIDRTKYWSLLE